MTNIKEKEVTPHYELNQCVSHAYIYNCIYFEVVTSILRKDNIVYCYCTVFTMKLITTQASSHSRAVKLISDHHNILKRKGEENVPKRNAEWKYTC